MISKPKSRLSLSSKTPSPYIKWYSISSPRPIIGIDGVFYINKEKRIISTWSSIEQKWIDFYCNDSSNVTTNNKILNSNTNKDILYSFSIKDNNLIITSTNGEEFKIPIVNEDNVNNKIKSLEERIEKIEELLE